MTPMTTRTSVTNRVGGDLLRHLPRGGALPAGVWARRHAGILVVLWLHIPMIFAYSLLQGESVLHSTVEVAIIVAFAGPATWLRRSRRPSTILTALGLLTCSAALVHLSGGLIEMHFHFFVIVGVVTLYQDWYPFLVSIAYVVLQHGIAGVLAPESVYNHQGAIESPWRWAAVHGTFILAMSAAGIATWRLNETLLISEFRKAQAFSEAQAAAHLGSWERNLLTGTDEWSEEMFRLAGLPPGPRPPPFGDTIKLVVPEDRERYVGWFEAAMETGSSTLDFRVERDGEIRWLHSLAQVTERTADGVPSVLSGTAQDVSDRMTTDIELRETLSLLGATLDATADGILVVDLEGRITSVNNQFGRMWHIPQEVMDSGDDEAALGYVIEQVRDPEMFMAKVRELYARPEAESEDTIEFKDGRVFERTSRPQRVGGEVVGRVWSFLDVTQRRALERELAHQAFHDSLTNLANQTLFRDRVDHALTRMSPAGGRLAVLFLDLDDFKAVNDSLGHSVGDGLLVAVSERVLSCLRPVDTAARLGGDEFAVLLEDVDRGEPAVVAQRILDSLRVPFLVNGRDQVMGASIGIAFSREGLDTEALLRNADLAMYTAKQAGRGSFKIFEAGMHEIVLQRVELERGLTRAVDDQQLVLMYQPVVALKTGQLAGVEALVRWNHPDHGLLMPGRFIDAAEESGAIVGIGTWVLGEACRQASEWKRRFPGLDLSMAVNVSPRQLFKPDFVKMVGIVLEGTGFPPNNLVLELTEGIMLADNELTTERLKALKALGVRLAVDDFGTGYSSMSYLRRLPFDILKIDKLFIDGIAEGPVEAAFALAIIRLAQTLGLETVAEGIEDRMQADALRELGCELAQGYLFARPLDREATEALLTTVAGGAAVLDRPGRDRAAEPAASSSALS